MKEYMGLKQTETLLVENKNRFVIFPIKHDKVSNYQYLFRIEYIFISTKTIFKTKYTER